MQTRHRVLGDVSWTKGKCPKARMRLVTSRCLRKNHHAVSHTPSFSGRAASLGHTLSADWSGPRPERESVKSTNAARDKPMSTDSSTRLEYAAWQDGGIVLFLLPAPTAHAASARPDPARSTAQDERSMVCSSWLFTRSSKQVPAWPVHQVRPNRGVGRRRCRAVR